MSKSIFYIIHQKKYQRARLIDTPSLLKPQNFCGRKSAEVASNFQPKWFPQILQLKDLLQSCNSKICLQRLTFSTNITSEKLVPV